MTDLMNDLRCLGTDEWRATGKDLIEDCAEPVDVGAFIDQVVASAGLLGGHEGGRSYEAGPAWFPRGRPLIQLGSARPDRKSGPEE